MAKRLDMVGMKFGLLTVVRCAGYSEHKRPKLQWECSCDCGGSAVVLGENLRSGSTRSCGCRAGNFKHGHCIGRYNGGTDSPTRSTWSGMVQRCTKPSHTAYERYGGKGITVCDRWMVFENFLADMGERPEGMTLDRKDNSKGYEPGNCRWATNKEQYENKRVVRDSNGRFTT